MQSSKISLVIPAYNEEKYIGACLDHVLKHCADAFLEIIVIDNASTDRTREVAEVRTGVKVVREDRKGLTRARHRGFLEARGDIIAYIDADTAMPAAWAGKVINEFRRSPELACLSGPCVFYDIPAWQRVSVKMYWYLLAMPVYLLVGYMVSGGNFAIRREVLEKMGGFDTSIEFYGEDTNIARRASAFGKVKFMPHLLMYTSGRRLAGQGLISTSLMYVINFLWEALAKKPRTREYRDIR